MNTTWAKEKAYNQKRAEVLREQMRVAIKNKDLEAFNGTYEKLLSHDYMSAKERRSWYIKFLREGM